MQENLQQLCDKCGRLISYGHPYIAIVYNIEHLDRDHLQGQDYIEVVSSDQIITLCGRCGNIHHAEATKGFLKTIYRQKMEKLN